VAYAPGDDVRVDALILGATPVLRPPGVALNRRTVLGLALLVGFCALPSRSSQEV
jgi:hypothetical protein